MTAVSITYILIANEGFRLNETISYSVGASFAFITLVIYLIKLYKVKDVNKESLLIE